ncbi:putative selenate ABC transporter substrate-binding protein [Xanthobacter pseudotagetidis]|uniref:putative selenate ABC transporter substrate-binding protein n=1 Tax=Xanthobacter pseudotagetidis TaxID=3119911 RepID=UPI0037275A74
MIRPLLAAAATAAVLLGASAAFAQTLTFSAIPDEDETKLVQRFTKVADYLSKTLGVPVKYVPVKSYGAAVTAFKNNQIQLGWFGGLSGVQARRAVPGSQALAQGEEDKAFVSYFIANAATGLPADQKDLSKAVAGKTFTFGAKTSTSGRLMPEFYIRKELGKGPEEVFSRVGFSGDHTKTVELVASGAYDVGAVNFTSFDDMVAKKQVDPAVVRIVWKTPPYPDYNWSIRGDADKTFGAGFTDKVRAALLGMTDPELLAAFPRKKFIPASNADYDPIVAVGQQLGLLD